MLFSLSGSSLLTLGFTKTEGVLSLLLEFSEAALGLTMIALLIAYLPTMYCGLFQARGDGRHARSARRDAAVAG